MSEEVATRIETLEYSHRQFLTAVEILDDHAHRLSLTDFLSVRLGLLDLVISIKKDVDHLKRQTI